MKIGVIGMGAMGSRMAKNFLQAGHEVYIYNRNQEKTQKLVDSGAVNCQSPRGLAEASEYIFSLVTNDQASQDVWFHPEYGAALALQGDKIAIESSTISYQWSKQLADRMRDFNYLETPLVGSRPQAEQRQLTLLVAGDQNHFEKAKSVFEAVSGKAIYLGEHSKAIALKLVINSLLGIQTAAFAELYAALGNSGFSTEQTMKILPNLPVTPPIMKMMLELFSEQKFAPLFPINLVEKDFSYANEFLQTTSTPAYVVPALHKVYQKAQEKSLGEQNISGILNLFLKGDSNEKN